MEMTDEELFIEARRRISGLFRRYRYKESLADCLLINRLIPETIRDSKEIDKIYFDSKDIARDYVFSSICEEVLFRFFHERFGICVEQKFVHALWENFLPLLQRYNEQEEML